MHYADKDRAEFDINNTYQASIKETPFFLTFGRHPRMPTDFSAAKPSKTPEAHNYIDNIEKAINKAKLCMQQAQEHQMHYADKDRADMPDYKVGELAWLSIKDIALNAVGTHKLLPRWLGPFTLTAKTSPVNFILEDPDHYSIHDNFHVSMLRRAYDNGAGVWRPAPIVVAGQDALEFTVEVILGHRPADKKSGDKGIKYRVKWKGYDAMENRWEPEKHIKPHAKGALSEYWKKQRAAVLAAQPSKGSVPGSPLVISRPLLLEAEALKAVKSTVEVPRRAPCDMSFDLCAKH